MINHFEEIRSRKPLLIAPGFKEITKINKPGTGELTIYQRGDTDEFIVTKQINSASLDKRSFALPLFIKMLVPVENVQLFLGFDERSARNLPEAVFQSSPDVLRMMHEKFQKEGSVVPEKVILKVYQDINHAKTRLREQNLYHPFVSMENIFYLNGKFYLTNPFIYDSFFSQLIDLAGLPPSDMQAVLDKRAEDNNSQLGFTLLQLGSLAKDEQLRTDSGYIKDNLRHCLRVVQERYSPDTARLIEQLIKGRDTGSRSPSPLNTTIAQNVDAGRTTVTTRGPASGPAKMPPLPGPIPIGRRPDQAGVGVEPVKLSQFQGGPNLNFSEINNKPNPQGSIF